MATIVVEVFRVVGLSRMNGNPLYLVNMMAPDWACYSEIRATP